MITNAYGKLREFNATLFRHVAALSLRRLPDFSPRHAANMLHAFARVDSSSVALFRGLSGRLLEVGGAELGAITVANACFAAGRAAVRHAELARAGGEVRILLEVLARRAVALDMAGRGELAPVLEARHIAALAHACLQAGAYSQKLAWHLADSLEARRLALCTELGDAPRVGPHRGVLLDIIDAAAAVRLSLERGAALQVPQTAAPVQDKNALLDETLRSSLNSLAVDATAQVDHREERRRLTPWDSFLAAWLPEDWPSTLRPLLLGGASVSPVRHPLLRPVPV